MEQGVETERKPVEKDQQYKTAPLTFVELIESNVLNDNNIEITNINK